MAAAKWTANSGARRIQTGDKTAVITALEANNLKSGAGVLGQIIVWNVGTGVTIDVYDDASSNTNPIWQWVTTDGKNTYPLQIPFHNGLRINASGSSAASFTVVYS